MINTTSKIPQSDTHNFIQSLPSNNPFVGLRPFREEEGILFFGRHQQTIELMKRLHQNRFLGVIGTSGCGKSSLIYAGLIPKLRAGFPVGERDHWRVTAMKPSDAPMRYLAQAILKTIAGNPANPVAPTAEEISFVKTIRLEGSQAILDRLSSVVEEANANLFLLIDQFEELFAFGLDTDDPERRDEAADFVSILLELANQRILPIYVVLTMRSDFLGECDNFYGLPEAMNRGQYLVPRLTRQQRQEAIESPITLFWQSCTPRLLDRVLNDIGEQSDQLPVMQHAMMRTWENWLEENRNKDAGMRPVDLIHYETAGTIKNALSNDANKALGETDHNTAKLIFQALTTMDANKRRKRNPVHIGDLEKITGASRDQIMDVVLAFSEAGGRSFLIIEQDQVTNNPRINISHESLIRQWDQMDEWLKDEDLSRDIYTRLADAAQRYVEDPQKGRLWRDPELQLAANWYSAKKPSPQWADRYHPWLAVAETFLNESLTERKAQNEREEAARQKELADALEREEMRHKQLRNFRIFSWILGTLMVTALSLAGYAMKLRSLAETNASQAGLNAVRALKSEQEALMNADLAKKSEEKARNNAATAERNAKEAKDNLLIAEDERRRADEKAAEAEQRKRDAIAKAEELKLKNRVNVRQFAQLLGLRAENEWGTNTETNERSALLAAYALSARDDDNNPLPTLEGDRAGRQVLGSMPRIVKPNTHYIERYNNVASFNRDGSQVAILTSNFAVQVRNALTGAVQSELKDFNMWPHWRSDKFVMSDDGQRLITLSVNYKVERSQSEIDQKRIKLEAQAWKTATGERAGQPIEINVESSATVKIFLSPDSSHLLTINAGDAQLWNTCTGALIATLQPDLAKEEKNTQHTSKMFSWASFSPDGKTFVTTFNKANEAIHVWDAATGKPTSKTIPPQAKEGGPVRRFGEIIYSPNGKYLVARSIGEEVLVTASLWDVETGKLLASKDLRSFRNIVFNQQSNEVLAIGGSEESNTAVRLVIREHSNGEFDELLDPITVYHSSPLNAVAFTGDGKHIVAIGDDGELTTRDSEASAAVTKLPMPNVRATAFTSDGKLLATANGNEIHAWDSKTGESSVITLDKSEKITTPASTAFSENGNFLATLGHQFRFWDVARRRSIVRKQKDRLKRTVFSSDGRYAVLIGEDNSAAITSLWPINILPLPKIENDVDAIAISVTEGSGYLAVEAKAGRVNIRKFSFADGKRMVTNAEEKIRLENDITALAFVGASGQILATANDKVVRLWNPETGAPIGLPLELGGKINSLTTDASMSLLAAACQDGKIVIWRWKNSPTPIPFATLDLNSPVEKVAFSQDEDYIAAMGGGKLEYWPVANWNQAGKTLSVEKIVDFSFAEFFRAPDSAKERNIRRVVSNEFHVVFTDGSLGTLDATSGVLTRRDNALPAGSAVALSPGDCVMVMGSVSLPLLWDVDDASWSENSSISISPDGKYVAVTSHRQSARVISVENPNSVVDLWHKDTVTSAEFDSSGNLITISQRKVEVKSGNSNQQDTSRIVSEAKIWDVKTAREIGNSVKLDEEIKSAAYDNIQGIVATLSKGGSTGSRNTISFWKGGKSWNDDEKSLPDAEKDKQDIKHRYGMDKIIFSPDGKFIVGTGDSGVHIWDTESKEEVAAISLSDARHPAFSRDGQGRLLTVTNGFEVGVWHWRPDDLVEDICSRLSRGLTQEEWQDYLGDDHEYNLVCQSPNSRRKVIAEAINLAENGRRKEAESLFRVVNNQIAPGASDKEVQEKIALEIIWHETMAGEIKKLAGINEKMPWGRSKDTKPLPQDENEITKGLKEAIGIFDQFWEGYKRPHIFPTTLMKEDLENEQSMTGTLNNLCWNGGLYGQAGRVRNACELLGELSPPPSGWAGIDSRGVVRAINGDFKGAVEDFQVYVKHATIQERIAQRNRWIQALENCIKYPISCKNPLLTLEEIKELRQRR